jgi:hypothetical protein
MTSMDKNAATNPATASVEPPPTGATFTTTAASARGGPLAWSDVAANILLAVGARSRRSRLSLLFAGLSLLFVAVICGDGLARGLQGNFPGIYRGAVSLAIAISEVQYGSTNLVGFNDVAIALEAHGIRPVPDEQDLKTLVERPELIDVAIDAAAHLNHIDRTKAFGLTSNETGTIDYYALAFRLFGLHNASFYWLFILLVAVVAASFPLSYWRQPIFVVPSLIYLMLLFLKVHELNPLSAQLGTPSNARFIPVLTLYPILYVLTLSASRQPSRFLGLILSIVAGAVFAFGASMRSQCLWQIGPLGLIVALRLVAQAVGRPWPRWCASLARQTIWPIAAFAVAAAGLTTADQLRRDPNYYADATAIGHPFWIAYLGATLPGFGWRIPALEKYAGQTISQNNDDAYSGILIRQYIAQHGEKLGDFLTTAMYWPPHPGGLDFWKEDKRDAVARAVALELWRKYPGSMLESYRYAFEQDLWAIHGFWIGNFWFFLALTGLIGVKLAPLGPYRPWCLTLIFVAAAPALGLSILVVLGALAAWYSLQRVDLDDLGSMVPPLIALALFVFPALCIMPVAGPAIADYVVVAWLAVIMMIVYAAVRRRSTDAGGVQSSASAEARL